MTGSAEAVGFALWRRSGAEQDVGFRREIQHNSLTTVDAVISGVNTLIWSLFWIKVKDTDSETGSGSYQDKDIWLMTGQLREHHSGFLATC